MMLVVARYLALTILLGPIEPRAESLASPWLPSVTATASLYWAERASKRQHGGQWPRHDPRVPPAAQALPHSRFDIRPMSGRRAKFPDRMSTSVRVDGWQR